MIDKTKDTKMKVTTGIRVPDAQNPPLGEDMQPASPTTQPMTLIEAVQEGLAVLKTDVDKLIAEALKENRAVIEKEVRAELAQKLQDERLENRQKQSGDYIKGSGLTDKAFGKRLISMNVPQKCLSVLRDEHMKLKDKPLWEYIRLNYKEKKVK